MGRGSRGHQEGSGLDTHHRLWSELRGTDPAPSSPAEARLGRKLEVQCPSHQLGARLRPLAPACALTSLPPRMHTHATPPAPPSLVSPMSLTPLGAVLSINARPRGLRFGSSVPSVPKCTGALPRGPQAAVPRGASVRGLGPRSLPAAGISPGLSLRPPPPR